MLDRLRDLLGSSAGDSDDEKGFRCVNCGAEFTRPHRECPECGGPFVAPAEEDDGV